MLIELLMFNKTTIIIVLFVIRFNYQLLIFLRLSVS